MLLLPMKGVRSSTETAYIIPTHLEDYTALNAAGARLAVWAAVD